MTNIYQPIARCALYQKTGWMVLEQRSKSYLSSRLAIRLNPPQILPTYVARDFSIKRKPRANIFQVCFTRQLKGIWAPLAVLRLVENIVQICLQSLPLVGLRADRLDSAAACWKLRKQILFSFEFGRRQTTGLDFDFYSSNSCLQTRKGDPTRK